MISVIIPTLNEADTGDSSLRNLFCQPGNFEVILADGGSTDGTQEVLKRFPAVQFVRSDGGRGRQMNEGAWRARGRIFLFLHADSVLSPEAMMGIEGVLSDPSVPAGSFCLKFNHPGGFFKVLSSFSRVNHRYFTHGDQALLLRATTLGKSEVSKRFLSWRMPRS